MRYGFQPVPDYEPGVESPGYDYMPMTSGEILAAIVNANVVDEADYGSVFVRLHEDDDTPRHISGVYSNAGGQVTLICDGPSAGIQFFRHGQDCPVAFGAFGKCSCGMKDALESAAIWNLKEELRSKNENLIAISLDLMELRKGLRRVLSNHEQGIEDLSVEVLRKVAYGEEEL